MTPISASTGSVPPPADTRAAVARDLSERVVESLAAPEVRIVFGGHFSCGKSSLINMLLGRDLLPTDDFPETGVTCEIRGGEHDRVRAFGTQGPADLAVSTSAIAGVVSLVDEEGGYRSAVHEVDRLDLTLAGHGAPPPGTVWVDSPGINDTDGMTERARAAAAGADVLVWVVNSGQPLAEVEAAFLDEHVARHGPHSVLVVVNVFLGDDETAAWARFLDERLAWFHRRLADAVPSLGDGPAAAVAVSARAAGRAPAHFGGPQVRHLVRAVDSPGHPRVRSARLHRGRRDLESALSEITTWRQAEEEDVRRRREARRAAVSVLRTGRRRFDRRIDREIGVAFAEAQTHLQAAVADIAALVDAQPLRRDGHYGALLTGRVHDLSTALLRRVLAASERAAQEDGLGRPSDAAKRTVQDALRPGPISIAVPTSGGSAGAGSGVGAVIGGLLGTVLLPGIGTMVGAGLGAGAGSLSDDSSTKRALARDRATTKAALAEAGRAVAAHLAERQGRVRACLQRPDALSPPDLPPEADEHRLAAVRVLEARFAADIADIDAEIRGTTARIQATAAPTAPAATA